MFDFHPLIGDWFARRFDEPTEPQRRAWPELQSGRDVLITAPTGSGKTLAAFVVGLDQLVKAATADALADQVQVLYVSPLRGSGGRSPEPGWDHHAGAARERAVGRVGRRFG